MPALAVDVEVELARRIRRPDPRHGAGSVDVDQHVLGAALALLAAQEVAAVVVRLVDVETGEPVPEALVRLEAADDARFSGPTRRDGRGEIGRLRPHGRGIQERVITVTGPAVGRKGNYRVPIGTPLRFLLEQVDTAPEVSRVFLGGPMMGAAASRGKVSPS